MCYQWNSKDHIFLDAIRFHCMTLYVQYITKICTWLYIAVFGSGLLHTECIHIYNGHFTGTIELPWLSNCRADSRVAPSQWETVLLCNDVSHWLEQNNAHIIWDILYASCHRFHSWHGNWNPIWLSLMIANIMSMQYYCSYYHCYHFHFCCYRFASIVIVMNIVIIIVIIILYSYHCDKRAHKMMKCCPAFCQ